VTSINHYNMRNFLNKQDLPWNAIRKGRKGKKKAIVATARKMTRVIYWMLKNKEPFHIEGYKPRRIHAK